MNTKRIIYSGNFPAQNTSFFLDENAAHYVTRVLRLVAGTQIELVDQNGKLAIGRLEWIDGKARITEVFFVEKKKEKSSQILLFAALIKQRRWEWMLEKATELNVSKIVPIYTSRTIISLSAKKQNARLARWQRIINEAAKQARRTTQAQIIAPIALEKLAKHTKGITLLLDEQNTKSSWPNLTEQLAQQKPISIIVGPEGGWTKKERQQINAISVGLGKNILRSETAAIAAIALVSMQNKLTF